MDALRPGLTTGYAARFAPSLSGARWISKIFRNKCRVMCVTRVGRSPCRFMPPSLPELTASANIDFRLARKDRRPNFAGFATFSAAAAHAVYGGPTLLRREIINLTAATTTTTLGRWCSRDRRRPRLEMEFLASSAGRFGHTRNY